ncbi:hypothetical protein K450DRAFT_239453 [Umbelopsis ramanniana AG]|uniref:HTH APSES-type domain-containing protein n=1 Tax=Umbelopsis ramanniana AG TaxID=1314678 RepID=A0AAD5HDB4_UMBRA|nr:uncharacterized protein K450DRAFT_239453 [Umbelopsis ramanniana AG]KAI8580110.1 hypothetical protein K450DRAFT_239453 [Umbelopsis ramanniana AG]
MADSVKNDDLSQVANQSDNENHSHSKQPLPSIHPDDARDKVFTAIMKALLKVGNKPSSPRELSNVITKYKYATLGGATPFATVSSRISQHFKRAAEHNPPRAPLLAKHVDQRHARKINYSLVTDSIQSKSPDSPSLTPSSKAKKEQEKPDHNIGLSTKRGTESSDSSPLSSEEDEAKPPAPEVVHHTRSMDKRKRSISKAIPVNSPPEKPSVRTHRPRRKTNSQYARRSESDNEADDEAPHPVSDNEASPLPKRQRKSSMVPSSTLSELSSQITPSTTNEVSTSSSTPAQLIHATRMNAEESESDSEFSDYHEEMLKGDLVMEDVAPTVTVEKKLSSRRATVKSTAIPHNNTTTSTHTATSSIQPQNNDPQSSPQLNLPSYTSPKSSPRLNAKKSNNGLLGDQDLWLPYSFDQDFDNVFLSDNSCVGNNVPLNIATPESISVSELDNYFASTTNGTRKSMTLGNHQRRPNNINGDFKGSPLLQKVLLPKQPINDESGSTHPQADVPTEHRETVETDTMEEAPSSPALETPDDSSIGSSDEDGYSSRRIQPYHIVEKVFGNLRVYELDSPGDIPNTKVMRFISTTDGSNNNIARRTRNAEIKKSVNSQHFYLDEGYVNATQLRKAAQPVLGKGSFDIEAESERNNAVVTITSGHSECRGAWVPLHRARELVEEYEIESSLGLMKLLSDEPIRLENQKEIQDVTDKLVAISSSTVSTPPSPRSLECNSQPNGSPTVAMMTTATAESSEELSSEQISESEDDDSFVKFEDADSKTETFVNTQANIAPNVASRIASSVAPSTGASAPVIPSTSSLVSAMTTSPATAAAVAAASSNVQSTVLSAVEILKTLNISNLNLQTLHQIAAAIPNLAHLAPTIKSVSASTNGKPTSNSSSPTLDIKAALSHFSALEALLKKEPSKAPTTTESTPTSPSKDANQPVIISTTVPTTPHMYITIIDNVAVYVTVLSEANGVEGEHLLMRRVDNGYINGTSLLKAGGIETEQERSIVLSLEVGRVRIPNKASRLHGTWIPLRRAQALAATCSLQHKLGAFLNDTIDTYFPNPLPISLPVSKKSPEGRLTAVTLTSLRSSTGSSKNGFLSHQQVSSSSGPSSPNNNNNNNNNNSAQLQQLLLSHNPSHSLNLKAPMLGCFDEEKKSHRKKKREISVVSSSNSCGGIASPNASVLSPVTIKSGPASDDASPSPPRHNLPTPDNDAAVSPSSSFVDVVESDEDTDTDTDVEEVREHMKKMRAAAMDAMENGSSMDLDEIISRARSPLAYRSTLSVSQATPKRTTRLSSKRSQRKDIRSIMEDDDDDDDEEDEDEDDEDVMVTASRRPAATRRTYSNVYNHHSTSHHRSLHTYGRRKPTGGKWAGGGSKLSPGMIKKSASWNGSISKSSTIVLPSRRNTTKSSDARKTTATTTESNLPKLTLIVPSPISEKSATVIEEDEDEEIDIGGSDRDDDLR